MNGVGDNHPSKEFKTTSRYLSAAHHPYQPCGLKFQLGSPFFSW